MKCPICGQELRPGKKDPNYLLCYNCKKKFKIPQSAHKVQKRAEKPEPEEQKYSNIPPKEVREKREQEMRVRMMTPCSRRWEKEKETSSEAAAQRRIRG